MLGYLGLFIMWGMFIIEEAGPYNFPVVSWVGTVLATTTFMYYSVMKRLREMRYR